MDGDFFGSVCTYLQWRVYVAYTVRRIFSSLERRLDIKSWSPFSVPKGKNADTNEVLIEVFSLGMSESEADERYLL